MAHVLDWRGATHRRDLVLQAVETLARGGTVCFPTETVYILAADAMHAEAVERVAQFVKRPLTVAVRGAAEALDWSPNLSDMGRRLARRCWPGPVTLICDHSEGGVADRLSQECRPHVLTDNTVRLRSPAHDAIQWLLMYLPEPVIYAGANPGNHEPAFTGSTVRERLSDTADLIIDDGTTRYGQPSSLIRICGESWSMVRSGVVSEPLLREETAFLVVFVCTGNTCRSPLAEGLCKKLLAEQLHCTTAELAERGFLVISAGLAAMMGGAAAAEAVQAAQELGADLSGHSSLLLTRELAAKADCIVIMTQGHLLTIAYQFPEALERCRLLRADGADVADPIGCEMDVYRQCAAEIAEQLSPLISSWVQK